MTDRPNIVLIMTDQQRADFFASEGFALDTMPFTESLGVEGVRFQRAYTPMPTCAPARTSMLTGRFPKATHVRENSATRHVFRPADLVETLRAQGYSINLSGKNHSYLQPADFDFYSEYWHTGKSDESTVPQEREFDDWLKTGGHKVYLEPTPFPLECQLQYRIVSDAISCVDERNQDQPFFLWLSFPEPHNPYQAPEPYFSLFPKPRFRTASQGQRQRRLKGANGPGCSA